MERKAVEDDVVLQGRDIVSTVTTVAIVGTVLLLVPYGAPRINDT